MKKSYIIIGSFMVAVAILLEAYANHKLSRVARYSIVSSFKTGATYQLYHAFALILLGILSEHFHISWRKAASVFFVFGFIFFSLAVYLINLFRVWEWHTLLQFIDFLPPIGGIAFVAGWLCMGLGMIYKK